uniref:Uncharacterized protein n=1 Tax=Ditylum brightwellii TaxID=49249 RepID=A0A6V2JYU7_9STRA|mmetsp:Transcript_6352/g.9635  ORF Transcript_6352/g.9635 Transcript_6352/m.9635 type:complete len:160 (-) Transcript_6352:422-901(-)
MVWGRIRDAIQGVPKLEGPSVLPEYFPVEPKGCEKHAENLFKCLANEATESAREMEKAGLHRSYYPDVTPTPGDENAAKKVQEAAAAAKEGATTITGKEGERLPTADDNPLDSCRTMIAYYKRCCDRELKKKHNWILTEPYRVQEEYRYKKEEASSAKK